MTAYGNAKSARQMNRNKQINNDRMCDYVFVFDNGSTLKKKNTERPKQIIAP